MKDITPKRLHHKYDTILIEHNLTKHLFTHTYYYDYMVFFKVVE